MARGGPNVTTSYSVRLEGPIFTGAIRGQVRTALRAIEDELGEMTVDAVRGVDDVTFRNPTGHARSQVANHREADTMVTDRQGLAYGPWLEDGGSRSDIFEGYGAFAKAARQVDQQVPPVVERNIERYVIQ